MKYFTAFILATSVAAAYITAPDKVAIDGRILITPSRPMASFPWKGEPPQISEHANQNVSDSRDLEALWEIRDGQLYLIAVSAYRFEEFAPSRSVGLRDLMPERIQGGRVLAEWFTGDFEVIEMERVERRMLLRPEDTPSTRWVRRKYHVEKGRVTEEPNSERSASQQPTPDAG